MLARKMALSFGMLENCKKLLGYDKWSNFEGAIEKAKIACGKAKQKILDHFAGIGKMVEKIEHHEK